MSSVFESMPIVHILMHLHFFTVTGQLPGRCTIENPLCRYPFLAAIFEETYDEDIEQQRYLGSGAILNHKWIMTSSKILRVNNGHFKQADGVFIRVGSDYWSEGGSVHEIKEIVYLGNKDTAPVSVISVTRSFPVSDLVQPVKLSRKRFISSHNSMGYYGWQSNDGLPLRMRKKRIASSQTGVDIVDNRECGEFNQTSDIFCCREKLIPMFCTHNRGSPLLDGEYLFGIHVAKSCDPKYNSTLYVFENVVSYYSWLSAIVGDIAIEV